MTTTATTARNNSASKSSPNDSLGLHETDSDGISASNNEHQEERKQEHDHAGDKTDPDDFEQSPSPPTRADPESSSPQAQSPNNDVTNESATKTPPTSTPATATTTTSSSSTTTAVASSKTAAVDKLQCQHLELSSPSSQQQQSTTSNSNNNAEQKRPMNAFLLFCKRQRSSVREKYPNLENRGITKILGDWWSKLDKEQKSKYTDLARQHKEAFMKAHPDFKWCKTPNVSNINNNIRTNNTNNESFSNSATTNNQQQPQQQQPPHNQLLYQQNNHQPGAATSAELLSLQSNHHPMDAVNHSSNGMDFMLTSRQQLEAPKPPKKRFLERNDSIYTTKNNHQTSNHETQGTDVVPYISFDQDTLNRVVDKIFSEDSSSSPSGANTCKGYNRNPTNLTSSSGNEQTSFSSSSAASNHYPTNTDEPVDFSMNRTFNTTRQEIIDNLVEKMLSEPSDDSSSFSKFNGTDSVKSHIRQPLKRDNPDDT